MTIVGICNVWKRHEIFVKMFTNWQLYHSNKVKLLIVLSINDPEREKHELFLHQNSRNIEVIYRSNQYLGRKWNSAIKYALNNMGADYIMKFDSDDLISPMIWEYYEYYFKTAVKYFGLDRMYCYNIHTNEALLFHYDQIFAARVIHKSLLKKSIYPDKAQCGLDTLSNKVIQDKGLIIETDYPMVIDLKNGENINSFFLLSHFKNFVSFVDSCEIWKNTHLTY